jgi:hypothetical protein
MAHSEDLSKQFETIKIREWPDLRTSLPHLLHNQMVVEHENKYWRRTPTYPVSGFQRDLNLIRFEKVPTLLGNLEKSQSMQKLLMDIHVVKLPLLKNMSRYSTDLT